MDDLELTLPLLLPESSNYRCVTPHPAYYIFISFVFITYFYLCLCIYMHGYDGPGWVDMEWVFSSHCESAWPASTYPAEPSPWSYIFIFAMSLCFFIYKTYYIYLFSVCLMWRSEDNLWELVLSLSFYHVGPKKQKACPPWWQMPIIC